jgi:hypothetical protein
MKLEMKLDVQGMSGVCGGDIQRFFGSRFVHLNLREGSLKVGLVSPGFYLSKIGGFAPKKRHVNL